MKKIKVLYYNISGNLDYENSLLQEWNVENLELTEIKDKENKFLEYAADMDGVVVVYEQITREKLLQLPHCKIITLPGVGCNNVDVAAATEQGVCITTVPGVNTENVAMHTIGLLLDLVRKISFLDRSVRAGHWKPLLGVKPHRLSGSTVGLVFFGNIPKAMTPVLKAMGLHILVYAPTKTKQYLESFGVQKAETLEELLHLSDFVSLHTPLLPETYHLIGEKELLQMKPSAFLLNTARGSVVDESALIKALQGGTIAGAGLDVIEDEQNARNSGLIGLENVVLTPHAAFLSEESFYECRRLALKQLILRLIEKKVPELLVNRDVKIDFEE